jgi:hypothetical protein
MSTLDASSMAGYSFGAPQANDVNGPKTPLDELFPEVPSDVDMIPLHGSTRSNISNDSNSNSNDNNTNNNNNTNMGTYGTTALIQRQNSQSTSPPNSQGNSQQGTLFHPIVTTTS